MSLRETFSFLTEDQINSLIQLNIREPNHCWFLTLWQLNLIRINNGALIQKILDAISNNDGKKSKNAATQTEDAIADSIIPSGLDEPYNSQGTPITSTSGITSTFVTPRSSKHIQKSNRVQLQESIENENRMKLQSDSIPSLSGNDLSTASILYCNDFTNLASNFHSTAYFEKDGSVASTYEFERVNDFVPQMDIEKEADEAVPFTKVSLRDENSDESQSLTKRFLDNELPDIIEYSPYGLFENNEDVGFDRSDCPSNELENDDNIDSNKDSSKMLSEDDNNDQGDCIENSLDHYDDDEDKCSSNMLENAENDQSDSPNNAIKDHDLSDPNDCFSRSLSEDGNNDQGDCLRNSLEHYEDDEDDCPSNGLENAENDQSDSPNNEMKDHDLSDLNEYASKEMSEGDNNDQGDCLRNSLDHCDVDQGDYPSNRLENEENDQSVSPNNEMKDHGLSDPNEYASKEMSQDDNNDQGDCLRNSLDHCDVDQGDCPSNGLENDQSDSPNNEMKDHGLSDPNEHASKEMSQDDNNDQVDVDQGDCPSNGLENEENDQRVYPNNEMKDHDISDPNEFASKEMSKGDYNDNCLPHSSGNDDDDQRDCDQVNCPRRDSENKGSNQEDCVIDRLLEDEDCLFSKPTDEFCQILDKDMDFLTTASCSKESKINMLRQRQQQLIEMFSRKKNEQLFTIIHNMPDRKEVQGIELEQLISMNDDLEALFIESVNTTPKFKLAKAKRRPIEKNNKVQILESKIIQEKVNEVQILESEIIQYPNANLEDEDDDSSLPIPFVALHPICEIHEDPGAASQKEIENETNDCNIKNGLILANDQTDCLVDEMEDTYKQTSKPKRKYASRKRKRGVPALKSLSIKQEMHETKAHKAINPIQNSAGNNLLGAEADFLGFLQSNAEISPFPENKNSNENLQNLELEFKRIPARNAKMLAALRITEIIKTTFFKKEPKEPPKNRKNIKILETKNESLNREAPEVMIKKERANPAKRKKAAAEMPMTDSCSFKEPEISTITEAIVMNTRQFGGNKQRRAVFPRVKIKKEKNTFVKRKQAVAEMKMEDSGFLESSDLLNVSEADPSLSALDIEQERISETIEEVIRSHTTLPSKVANKKERKNISKRKAVAKMKMESKGFLKNSDLLNVSETAHSLSALDIEQEQISETIEEVIRSNTTLPLKVAIKKERKKPSKRKAVVEMKMEDSGYLENFDVPHVPKVVSLPAAVDIDPGQKCSSKKIRKDNGAHSLPSKAFIKKEKKIPVKRKRTNAQVEMEDIGSLQIPESPLPPPVVIEQNDSNSKNIKGGNIQSPRVRLQREKKLPTKWTAISGIKSENGCPKIKLLRLIKTNLPKVIIKNETNIPLERKTLTELKDEKLASYRIPKLSRNPKIDGGDHQDSPENGDFQTFNRADLYEIPPYGAEHSRSAKMKRVDSYLPWTLHEIDLPKNVVNKPRELQCLLPYVSTDPRLEKHSYLPFKHSEETASCSQYSNHSAVNNSNQAHHCQNQSPNQNDSNNVNLLHSSTFGHTRNRNKNYSLLLRTIQNSDWFAYLPKAEQRDILHEILHNLMEALNAYHDDCFSMTAGRKRAFHLYSLPNARTIFNILDHLQLFVTKDGRIIKKHLRRRQRFKNYRNFYK